MFAPETAEVWEWREESGPAGASAPIAEAVLAPAARFEEGRREAFDERAAIMEFDGGLSSREADAAARVLLTEAQGFGIVWPLEGHGAGCAAFNDKAAARP